VTGEKINADRHLPHPTPPDCYYGMTFAVARFESNSQVPPSARGSKRKHALVLVCVAMAICIAPSLAHAGASESYAIAMHGDPALPANFSHMPYANPDAPKGGRLRWGLLGTFDSLNPLIVKGLAVQQIRGFVVESLMTRGYDEPFTLYGLLAKTVETDDERTYVTFHLDPRARFSDGTPVVSDDVLFSWALLRDRGRPNHRQYYSKVARAEALDRLTVRFDLAGAKDRELPLILGLMPVLPKHAVDPATFEETTMKAPIGSGPYRVSEIKPGASLTLTRNPDYWGRDLPVNRGLWNFDEVRLDFYREANGHFEAFKRALYDFRVETEPLRWHDGYDFPASRTGQVVRDTFKINTPQPSEFLVFNTRRPVFADIRVRKALTLLLDFEWINRNYFFGLYGRSGGYFAGSELSAYERPADARERDFLSPFMSHIDPAVLDGSYRLPVTDGSGRDRTMLGNALKLLSDAGYRFDGTELRLASNNAPLAFEIMVTTRDQERIALAFQRDLRRAGIQASVRVVDTVQFDQRRLTFDFDMIPNRWDQSLSPGNEQSFYWGSAAADTEGTRNYMGVRDPAVDALIAAMLGARDRSTFVSAVRALDRTLTSGFYAIPVFNLREQWIARWNWLEWPKTTSLSGYFPETWWQRPDTRGQ
jgi:peptide/nickel transport system substrate-binding protein